MTLHISEWFGHRVQDKTTTTEQDRKDQRCPFLKMKCTKTFNDGSPSGVCSVYYFSSPRLNEFIPICPNRMYSGDYMFLSEVAADAFGEECTVLTPVQWRRNTEVGISVVAFGKRFGSELKLPKRGGKGGYFVDWILARIENTTGKLIEFVAIEVQTIDTTGTYKPQVELLQNGKGDTGAAKAGLNWENVNKRILPQLIYKGHVLRRERLCTKGLFFICPSPVYRNISKRLGENLLRYDNLQPGSIVFRWYDMVCRSNKLEIQHAGSFPTTVDQVANAFTSPTNLPEAGAYESAIRAAISRFKI